MFLKSEIWVSVVCKKYINMDKEFFDENLLLLLFQHLNAKKYIFVVEHQCFGLTKVLTSRNYLPR